MPIFVYILFIISFCTSLCAKDINHPADINKNWIIEIKEFNDYNEAWRKNIQWQTPPYTIPKDYVTRCGFLLNYGGVYYYSEEQPPLCWKAGQKPFVNSLGMSFVYVTPGSFIMGSPEDEINRDPDEKQHHVQLTHTVLIQTTEVTQKQWAIVMGSNPSYFEHCGENCPVEMVSWNDVQLFIEKINAMENNKYRLPTEAEWEYSARAGSISAYYWGNRADCQSMMYENNAETSENFCVDHFSLSNLNPTSTAPVQSFDTNNWNLFDMHGNVWEWCHDWFAAYSSSPVTDPSGPLKGNYKVIRGGAWNSNAAICRSAYRGYASPENRYNYIGFRLVCLSLAKKQNNISIGETLQSTFINRVGINLETRIISSTNCPNAITVNINGNETLSSIAIEEYLPHDITPTQIYQNGIFCPETHSIRWGAFLSNNQRMMTYNVTGPVSTYKIEGNTSINGKSRTITGENELIPRQCSSIINPLLNIITIHLPETECGDYYEKQINASGGHKPLTFSMVKGNLPTGLSLNNENGMISGNSSSTGSFVFSIGVSDRSGDYVEREFAINVVLPLTITTHSMLPHGTKNVSYFENIIISGGTAPYTITKISGTLPEGLQLLSSGKIQGIPETIHLYEFTLNVSDSLSRFVVKTFELQIVQPLEIVTNQLKNGIVGHPYEQKLFANGGWGTFQWRIYSGKLPSGLIIDNSANTISGIPSTPSYQSLVLSVSDNDNRLSYKDLTLHIENPLDVELENLPDALKDTPYYENIPITGGIGPYTFECEGLPPDLTIDPKSGLLSGVSTVSGINNVGIYVSDSSWPESQRIYKKMRIHTVSAFTIFTNAVLPKAVKNVPIQPISLNASHRSDYWQIVEGYLPAGITLDSKKGLISGTPMDKGNHVFSIQVTDIDNQTANKTFIWHITDSLRIQTNHIPDASNDNDYHCILEAIGGIPPYTWRLKAGELPSGLLLNETTGTITGKPEGRTARSFLIEINDSDVPAQIVEKEFIIDILARDDLYIFTPDLPEAKRNCTYHANIEALHGNPPYDWRLKSGVLPTGIQLHSTRNIAQLTGLPNVSGAYVFTIMLTDATTPAKSDSKEFCIHVYDTLTIQTNHLNNAEYEDLYEDQIQVTGGKTPYIWRLIDGRLPDGILLNPSNGVLSGTLKDLNSSEFTIQVKDNNQPSEIIEKPFTIFVVEKLSFVTDNFQHAKQSMMYHIQLEGSGGFLPYQWNLLQGTLPKCFYLDPISGIISGRPAESGQFDFSIKLTDSSMPIKTAIRSFRINVLPELDIIEGDINQDDLVNLKDIIIIQKILADFDVFPVGFVDINGNCYTDLKELIYVMGLVGY